MNSKTNSITEGPVWKGLLKFFFPILLGTFFQQLYNTVDAVIVGKFVGKEALAAVGGGTAFFVYLLVGFFVGLSSGAGVVISQYYGAKNKRECIKAVHSSLSLAFIGGALVMILGLMVSPFAMKMLGTPDEIMDMSLVYLRIYFYSMIPLMIYNMAAGILRAIGNSLTPLIILIIACFFNIFLDIFFVIVLKMSVAGVAWATMFSQTLCAAISLIYLSRCQDEVRFSLKKICFTPNIVKYIIKIGLPTGIQSTLYTVSNLIIQSNINKLGTTSIAAAAAWGKIDTLFWMTINALGIAVTTFAGQNYGAGNIKRVHEGTRQGIIISVCFTSFLSIVIMTFGKTILSIFSNDESVIETGLRICKIIAPLFVTYISVEVLSGSIRGCGHALIPTLITLFAVCILRVVWMFTVVTFNRSIFTIYISYPITWLVSSILFWIYYLKIKNKL